ncbi:uncharacterized protein LOC131638809 [Vicia villosa]|uniref:uncharacterized protein LOC131638809 n=1 Tax=Vicia villosa TaxID=3911 RepID=UPI00273BE0B4|nr:uncharacterized protein LOC131638809 [Vicia villosa]
MSSIVVDRWDVIGKMIGDRDISDHCPIWIMTDNNNWGPKPFKFNNEWFSFDSFIPFVEKEWLNLKVEGSEEGVRDVNFADERLDPISNSPSSFDDNLSLRKEASSRLWRNLRIRENMLLQKSKSKWIREGDSNSGFFHKVMSQRRRRNHIGPIVSSGTLVDSVEDVREVVFDHFANKFIETEENRPLLDGISFKEISREEAVRLEKPFLEHEIKEAVWNCGGSKSPGPDGCLYKVVAKVLARRLKCILNSIISPFQSTFVPGRQLLDGVLVANEVVDFARKEGSNCILFKVDFEKAYDKVSWNFLRYILKRMGFGEKWRRWMKLLVFSSKMSILVNGSPTKEFEVSRGLRQGDPLSPFLFVLVTEALSRLVRKSVEGGEFQSFTFRDSCKVDILQFADDTLTVGNGNWKHVWALRAVLRAFELVLGLGINYQKSIPIGFNPRKETTWNPLLLKMKNRLEGWTNRFLNLGGRITLLKFVLSSLSIFTMSFYKMPRKVRWRILQGQNSLWLRVLKSRYGDVASKVFGGGTEKIVSSSCSMWWKDIVRIFSSFSHDPIASCSKFIVHKGYNTPFWESIWLEGTTLKNCFPDLFHESRLKNVSVAAMGGWVDGVWKWGDFGLPENVRDNGVRMEEVLDLKDKVTTFSGWSSGHDTVSWTGNSDLCFSVGSCYAFYENLSIPYGPPINHAEVFGILWETEVPFKIKAFGWRLFHNRLPTKDCLTARGMSFPIDALKCIFCGYSLECRNHYFFSCLVVKNIWRKIVFWVGKGVIFEEECRSNFMEWRLHFHSKKVKDRKLGVVWLATTWILWLVRNGHCFRKEAWNVNNTVWNIKLLVRKWSFFGKITHPNYTFYEFSMDPLYYLS